MEEDIDILENLINVLNTGMCKFGENIQMNDCGYQEAIENLLQAYKQDEKIIKEIAKAWKQDDIRSVEEIIDYFRKRCE